jgi:hypothetical protein
LQGTTIWVNEHMAVGHVMYDIPFIQAMQSTNVRRIVIQVSVYYIIINNMFNFNLFLYYSNIVLIQRSVCNDDHCMGVGTWNSFFLGYYTSMIDAFRPGIPIYMVLIMLLFLFTLHLTSLINIYYNTIEVYMA